MEQIRLLAIAFGTVFIAELGDKTQLATLSLAAGNRHGKLLVFIGAAAALVTTSAIAVLVGEALPRYVNPNVLRKLAGAAFIVLGALYLLGKGD